MRSLVFDWGNLQEGSVEFVQYDGGVYYALLELAGSSPDAVYAIAQLVLENETVHLASISVISLRQTPSLFNVQDGTFVTRAHDI